MNVQTPTAVLALLLWIPISIVTYRYLHPRRATFILLLGAIMFLPQLTEFKIPVIPKFNKQSIATLCVFFCCLAMAPHYFRTARSGKVVKLLLIMLFIGIVGSVMGNRYPLVYGPTVVPALVPRNILTFVLDRMFFRFIPFYCGLALVRNVRNLGEFLVILVKAGLIYSLFVLFEVRMSPQLNSWVYGFNQHSWLQAIREGGYRPLVFMHHGLATALFTASTAIAAAGLARVKTRVWRLPAIAVSLYLAVVLLLSNSFGALIFGIICIPLVLFASVLQQIRVAVFFSIIVFLYPILRTTDIFPADELVEWSSKYSEQRAQSLGYRFYNEDLLLEKAMQKPNFGWGGFARIRVFDNETGNDLTTTDGAWIIDFAAGGYIAFIPLYGLLIWPILLAYRKIDGVSEKKHRSLLGCMCLIAAVNAVDLIPNGLFSYFPYMFSGIVLGTVNYLKKEK